MEALRLLDDQPRTLSDLFKLVRPDADVPEALASADERVLAASELTRERLALDPNFLTDLAEREALELRASHGEGEQELGKLSQAAITCSGDFFGDQWGAAWFKQNFGTPCTARWFGAPPAEPKPPGQSSLPHRPLPLASGAQAAGDGAASLAVSLPANEGAARFKRFKTMGGASFD